MIAALNSKVWWYTARSSGLVAWGLVTASVLWGLVLSGRLARRLPPPAWTLDLHRFLGGLSVAFTGIHLSCLAADNYLHFGWSELFVPLAVKWRPGPVALGIVGLYVLVAIEVTSLAMRWLPRRFWRRVHYSSAALFALATVHALTAGTDARNPGVRWFALASAGGAALLVGLRVLVPRIRKRLRPARAA